MTTVIHQLRKGDTEVEDEPAISLFSI